ncbi:isopropylmalate/citramalate/homocitrate synthase [Ferroglobus placidus DSM 10642]|uniref:Putative (R)-citramalate synthase CimA n=1 Tax=Ferroglobus placidus (strain DSM 10642 / AEDII12DO) TaxID=589924 RepID=D3RYJ8_FERPA|nr:2-isopropylmalate synthase [Ferroglobus placidus]ADC65561.1 isopropylmalate/citramalate/homocitrate synthase [Ferroglobus placidus DSM 10642]
MSVIILDTTLRDGEQTPGVSLSVEQKLMIAEALDNLGVDIIEAGTAIASEGEFKAIKAISEAGLKAEICSFGRIKKEDIDAAADAGADSIFMVAPSSDIHINSKFPGKTREDIIQMSIEMVEYAKERGLIVEFGGEDASRADFEFIKKLLKAGEEAGADRLTFTDTVGVLTPERAQQIMSELKKVVKKPVAFHGHDDFGLATANTIFAVKGGADEIHCCVNGLGERAGNAALEEVVMALEYLYGIKTKINKKAIYPTSKLVEKLTRVVVPPNKPIVGENAFTHESGIHTSAVLRDAKTYEPISPEVIGRSRSIVLGKHAGKASVEAIMKELGYKATKEQMQEILKRVKEIGDKGKRVTDADVRAIIETVLQIKRERKVELVDLNVVSGANIMPTASVKLKINGKEYVEAGVGVGPVDAAINAIKRAVKEYADIELVSYHVDAITGGTDALVDVIVQLKKGDKIVTARGARTDIIMASVEAFVEGLNMLL